ncbi:MAG: HD domain-containing protein [Clostridia bacterium]|nr:HD domain-containing protein [Clostridia bacterium]
MDFSNNGIQDAFLMVKSADRKVTQKGMPYLDLILCDKTGEITAKLWDYHEEVQGVFEPGTIVKIRGSVSPYNGVDQLRIEKIRKALPSDGVDPSDFVPSADLSGDQLYSELMSIAENMADSEIRSVVCDIYTEYKDKLTYWPAAFRLHHAIRGGLLYHTLSIVRLAQSVCKIYPSVNADLLIGGAMLHDIAKTDEFIVNDAGTASGYSLEGNLVGHLAKGAMIIGKSCEKLGVSDETMLLLQHMVLSHHGEPEFGAAVRPMFLEAELLSELDLMDARVYELTEAIGNVQPGEYTNKMWALDNRKFYNHGRNEVDTKAKLI